MAQLPTQNPKPEFRSTLGMEIPQENTPAEEEREEDSIRVFVRVRPLSEREQQQQQQENMITVNVASSSLILRGDFPRHFVFDGVLGPEASQDATFDTVAKSIVGSCLAGYNGSIYVYGQTGTGKTYTMSGLCNSSATVKLDTRGGLIGRMLAQVFSEISRRTCQDSREQFRLRCSFLEIYKEQIMDLLEPSSTGLPVREDINRGVYVERLSEPVVTTLEEAQQVLRKGMQSRHIGATHVNELSSRSHAVFTLYVERAATVAGVTSTRTAVVNMVDLAGSERQQSSTAAAAVAAADAGNGSPSPRLQSATSLQTLRAKEAGAINKSLSALTNVIMSLSRDSRARRRSLGTAASSSTLNVSGDGTPVGRKSFVGYRDSKLTFLLRDSLGGNSKTVVCATVSLASVCYSETLSTLKFASRAKFIRCSAVKNEEYSGTIESLMSEVKSLRAKLLETRPPGVRTSKEPPSQGHQPYSSPTISDNENDDNTDDVGPTPDVTDEEYWQEKQWAGRLEVLLGAAVERTRNTDAQQHQLRRLARFLEDLDTRKGRHIQRLLSDYEEHLGSLTASELSQDHETKDLSEKLLNFQFLLGNLLPSAAVAFSSMASLPTDVGGGGGGEGSVCDSNNNSDNNNNNNNSNGNSNGNSNNNNPEPSPAGSRWGPAALDAQPRQTAADSAAEEKEFLREENRRLRGQLGAHREMRRLAAENRALREQLGKLCGSSNHLEVGSMLYSNTFTKSAPEGESTGLDTGMYFQKLAKEAGDVACAHEALSALTKEMKLGTGEASLLLQRMGDDTDGSKSILNPCEVNSYVDKVQIDELMKATNDAFLKAQEVLRNATGDCPADAHLEDVSTDEQAIPKVADRISQLNNLLDTVSTAHSECFQEFQQLREEYEHSLEECLFYELQIGRLDMHCQDLMEKTGLVASQQQSQSTTGIGFHSSFGAPVTDSSKRSFSLSSLRDSNFWTNRFQELSRLSGVTENPSTPSASSVAPSPRWAERSASLQFSPISNASSSHQQTTPLLRRPYLGGGSAGNISNHSNGSNSNNINNSNNNNNNLHAASHSSLPGSTTMLRANPSMTRLTRSGASTTSLRSLTGGIAQPEASPTVLSSRFVLAASPGTPRVAQARPFDSNQHSAGSLTGIAQPTVITTLSRHSSEKSVTCYPVANSPSTGSLRAVLSSQSLQGGGEARTTVVASPMPAQVLPGSRWVLSKSPQPGLQSQPAYPVSSAGGQR